MSIATARSTDFDPFSHDMWDLFNGFPFDRNIPSSLSIPFDTSDFTMACIDWKETPQAHVLQIDLPGMKKEEVKVEVDGNILQISGERTGKNQDENVTWHLVERSSGRFMRKFRLSENVKMDQIKAAMENGVLTVTVPKTEVKNPDQVKSRSIEIEGGQGGVTSCLKMPRLFKSKKL